MAVTSAEPCNLGGTGLERSLSCPTLIHFDATTAATSSIASIGRPPNENLQPLAAVTRFAYLRFYGLIQVFRAKNQHL